MSEIYKGVIISFVVFIFWSAGCFVGGYLLSNRQAVERLREENIRFAEQQCKYDELIRESENRIRESEERVREANKRVSDIREQLLGKISDNGETTTELSKLAEQIRKQKLNLEI